ncbi:type IX secretion system outer membrane channel protein PorV [Eisenibacter elegans]|jgi:hypothetical protein|uniref:type IX secretion system outer membrane channel protein PorV n=1 Tax=Eisenibacter elegans TaxID=997 RepID=UPI0004151AB6|nr:type IX secretion system outer membrane channel protein PorV [Eisenibacter elegans]
MMLKKISLLAALLICSTGGLFAQNPALLGQDTTRRVINTSLPFLNIAPDARSAGMGDMGVAMSPDANTTHWNASKVAFLKNKFGFAFSYSPWLQRFVGDMSLSYLSGYYKIDELQGLSSSLRYFNLGNFSFTDDIGNPIRDFTPREFAFDVSYARKLSERLSVGVTARYLHSNLTADLILSNQTETRAVNSASFDLSMFYQSEALDFMGLNSSFAFGANLSNLGPKVSYSNANEADFIPTNLRVGFASTTYLDDYNKFTFGMDFNKLLVPTPPQIDGQGNIISGRNPRDVGVIQGMASGLFQAPGGFREKMQEVSIATGVEYWYNDLIAARIGYFYENENKGNRRYFTIGLGMRYNLFGLDVAYLLPQNQNNPLAETLRFTLLFDFKND